MHGEIETYRNGLTKHEYEDYNKKKRAFLVTPLRVTVSEHF
jgi:hypothetical protein